MSSLPPNTDVVDVLIIGAGPAGLSTALSVYHYTHLSPLTTPGHCTKPKILLMDSLLQGQNKSRALGFHSRTLEVSYYPLAHPNTPLTLVSYSPSTRYPVPRCSSRMAYTPSSSSSDVSYFLGEQLLELTSI